MLGKLENTPKISNVLHVDDEIFNRAWEMFEKLSSKGLSFTDCTSIAFALDFGLTIMSFDDDFDGIINRIF